MISLSNTENIIATTLLFFAYVMSITCAGSFQALVAKWLGDDTASRMGYSELNPFSHIGLFGIICFVLIQFMAGYPIPIDIRNLKSSWFGARLFLVFASRTFLHLFIATISWIGTILLCGPLGQFIPLSPETLSPRVISLAQPNLSSISVVLCMFFGILVVPNVLLAMFSAIRQGTYGVVMYKFDKDYSFITQADALLTVVPLLIIFFFGGAIYGVFQYLVGCSVFGITKFCGVL